MIINRLLAYAKLMRLHKPIGIYLFLWPTLWALWIAAHGQPQAKLIVIFGLGVVIMRSAGCIINDIADRDFDGHVRRTQDRPLVTGQVSVKEAYYLFIGLGFLALILVLQLNEMSFWLAPVCLGFAILYPFLKRYTYWPQLCLGATCSWSIPMAFAAQLNHIPFTGWLLYLGATIWPLAYDTLYAMVDRDDDKHIGVKSTALLFGQADCLIVAGLQLLALSIFTLVGLLEDLNAWYYLSLFSALVLVIYQLYLVRHRKPAACFKAFLNNNWVGMVIFVGLLLNYLPS